MQVTECYYPEAKLTELEWLDYELTVSSPHVSDDLLSRVISVLSADEIKIEKKTKSGIREVDIRSMIGDFSAEISGGELKVYLRLKSSPDSFLSPDLVIKALRLYAGLLTDENLLLETYTLVRTHAYKADMSEFR